MCGHHTTVPPHWAGKKFECWLWRYAPGCGNAAVQVPVAIPDGNVKRIRAEAWSFLPVELHRAAQPQPKTNFTVETQRNAEVPSLGARAPSFQRALGVQHPARRMQDACAPRSPRRKILGSLQRVFGLVVQGAARAPSGKQQVRNHPRLPGEFEPLPKVIKQICRSPIRGIHLF